MMELTGGVDFRKQQKELDAELQERISSGTMPEANILVAGITGTGKSTLVNAIFGNEMAATGTGQPITKEIKSDGCNDIPVKIWDTVGLELDSTTTRESIKNIKQTIAEKSSLKDPFNRMHCIWYCINSGSNRYQGAELEFIKELYSVGVPFIIILTQCWGDENEVNNFEREIRRINSEKRIGNIDIVQVMAQEMKMRNLPPIPPFGLDTLVDTTMKKLPEFIKSSFAAAQKISRKEKREAATQIIMEYVNAAQNGFWEKVPVIRKTKTKDHVKNMINKLATIYNTVLTPEAVDRIAESFTNNRQIAWNPMKGDCDTTSTNQQTQKHEKIIENLGWLTLLKIDLSKDKQKELQELFSRQENNMAEEMKEKSSSAKAIAFYGCIFMDSIDEVWNELNNEQLNQIDTLIDLLAGRIKRKLSQYR